MTGLLIQLAISWLIVWLAERGNLSVLGLYPTRKRLSDFALFFLLTAACCSTGFLLRMQFGKERWELNPLLTATLAWKAVWWNIKSVLFEELIFRGVIFYLLIKKTGALKAMLISSAAFGIYHWFSHEVFGNIPQMAITFALTGIMGMLYAYGYVKTNSLYVPCAIHAGWNLTQGFLFSQGPIGNGVLILAAPQPMVTVSHLVYWSIFFIPLLSAWILNFMILRNRTLNLPSA